ncbi:hypothetical protein LTR37_007713 [Vermiconidia calcicola]|uniref:Uncharacterized protein n=1 Tax=Vermiconidia calcicola TaxID=1690605 RepID=A0ACC3NE57_9PEZI|nr:hypothetical protein LTR37_007713 [Vermiconidia calcicola]
MAVLSEDRFLARSEQYPVHVFGVLKTDDNATVGWGNTQNEPAFGGGMQDNASVKGKLINLINSSTLSHSAERGTAWNTIGIKYHMVYQRD